MTQKFVASALVSQAHRYTVADTDADRDADADADAGGTGAGAGRQAVSRLIYFYFVSYVVYLWQLRHRRRGQAGTDRS